MTISNVVKIASTTGSGGGGGGGGSMCIIGGCGAGSAEVINSAPVGTDYGLVTRPIITGTVNVNVVNSTAGTVANTFNTVTLVPANVLTTVVSYTVPAGVTFQCTGYVAGGDTNAAFTLYINGAPVIMSRSTTAQQTVQTSFFGANPSVPSGQTLVLRVLQQNTGIQGNYEGTILGSYM